MGTMRRALVLFLALPACGAAPQSPSDAGAPLDGAPAAPGDLAAPNDLAPVAGPMLLSQTGLYDDWKARRPAPGVRAYAPRYEQWTDGAVKERFLFLPAGTKIDTGDMDNWRFPVGTKAWEHLRAGGRLVETRYLEKVYDDPSGWWQSSYRWDAAGTDAVALPDGGDDAIGAGSRIPSQEECGECHGDASDVLVGVSALQLSSATGHGALSALAAAGLLTAPPPSEFQPPGSGAVQDALGYLHGNCSHCHNGLPDIFRNEKAVNMRLLVAYRSPEETPTYTSTINQRMFHWMPDGTPDGVLFGIVPGKPEKSQLWRRMGSRDGWQMPPLGTHIVDPAGLAAVHDWIASLH